MVEEIDYERQFMTRHAHMPIKTDGDGKSGMEKEQK
jgi:hypothetical protein